MGYRMLLVAFATSLAVLTVGASANAACGDGTVETSEECDDGDLTGGDGCSPTCEIEDGYTCATANFELDVDETFPSDEPSPNWVLSADKLSVLETVNSAAGIYSTTLPASRGEITFSIEVQTTSDDDFFGFAIGYQAGENTSPTADYLIVDWKQIDQDDAEYGESFDGIALSRVLGPVTDIELWQHASPMNELARGTNYGSTGWDDNTVYEFRVNFAPDRIVIDIREPDGSGAAANFRQEFDFSPNASTPGGELLPDGNFGFYVLSQQDVRFELIGPTAISLCELTVCGDGLVEGSEECDLGAQLNGTSCACADACTVPAAGTTCEAGDLCSTGDTCDGSGTCDEGTEDTCTGATPFCDASTGACSECASASDCGSTGNECTVFACTAGFCVEGNETNGTSCTDDGDFCTGTEICQAGVCEGGGDPCGGNTPFCDSVARACVECGSASDCDDGNACNGDETCDVTGSCQPGVDLVCDTNEVCEDPAGDCICAPGFVDDGGGACVASNCTTDLQCDDSNVCTDNVCSGGLCSFPPANVGGDCDNGDFCDGAGACDSTGVCVEPGNPCGIDTPVCLEDADQCYVDTDGDGVADSIDPDDDGDGILDADEGDADTDGDDVPNLRDLDADGDGIPDNIEAQSTDGYVVPSGADTDGDGVDDAYDPDNGGAALTPVNSDGDSRPDFLDTDSDGDGLDDDTESGQALLTGVDADDDGLDDAVDADTEGFGPVNGQISDPRTDLADTTDGGDVDFREADGDGGGGEEPNPPEDVVFTGGGAVDCSSAGNGRLPFGGLLILAGGMMVVLRRRRDRR